MSEKVRRTAVWIEFDGVDITEDLKPYLLSVSYTDSEEDTSDSLEIKLQDREGLWLESWMEKAVKATAAERLTLRGKIIPEGWGTAGGELPTGRFELDSVEAEGPPGTVRLKGSALAYGSTVRQTKKTRVWKNRTLKGIAGDVAGEAGLGYVYEVSRNPAYKRKEQNGKSDIVFLSELCHDEGISLKCTDGKLVLFDQRIYEALPPVMTIRRGKGQPGEYLSYSLHTGSAETQYGSCRVSCADPATGRYIEGTAKAEGEDGKSEQRLELRARVESAGEAQALAEQMLRLYNKFNRSASFTLPGNTALAAGVTVRLEGFGGWDGKYMVKQAVHTVSDGYTTKAELRKTPDRPEEPEKAAGSGGSYTVQPGDTLWKIARTVYGSGALYPRIHEANRGIIGADPGSIYPGQVLTIP